MVLALEPPVSVDGEPSLRARLFGVVEEQPGVVDGSGVSPPPLSKSWKGRFAAIEVDGPGCPNPTRI